MQIDFHHAVTYVVARSAGLGHQKAEIIAHAAQYVDDATNAGLIQFDNGAMYQRISSAHKMLDYRNSDELANHQVWIPFHFLPGNGGLPAGKNPKGSFIQKLICRPDSHVARDMLRACALDLDKPYAWHRVGITMHVYADTWAHQGFAGVNHKVNEACDLSANIKKLENRWKDKIVNFFISESFPLGHGAVLSYPDRPYLKWSYTNGLNKRVDRDNPTDFLTAADKLCRAIQCFMAGDETMNLENQPGLATKDKQQIKKLIGTIRDDDGETRHEKWLAAIAAGKFTFGPKVISYKPKGVGSWKYKSIRQKAAADREGEKFPYAPSFLSSNWKMFHDALQAHRFDVIHDILPRYGISAA